VQVQHGVTHLAPFLPSIHLDHLSFSFSIDLLLHIHIAFSFSIDLLLHIHIAFSFLHLFSFLFFAFMSPFCFYMPSFFSTSTLAYTYRHYIPSFLLVFYANCVPLHIADKCSVHVSFRIMSSPLFINPYESLVLLLFSTQELVSLSHAVMISVWIFSFL
jgi:hypothetical protein